MAISLYQKVFEVDPFFDDRNGDTHSPGTKESPKHSYKKDFVLHLVDLQSQCITFHSLFNLIWYIVCNHFREAFEGFTHVQVTNGRFEDLDKFDCIVSAGNR